MSKLKIDKREIVKYGSSNMLFKMSVGDNTYHFVTTNKQLCLDALDKKSYTKKASMNLLTAQCVAFNKEKNAIDKNQEFEGI